MYKWVIETEELTKPINYIEFGVAAKYSFKWWLEQNKNAQSEFYGFDFLMVCQKIEIAFKKGSFSNANELPIINDDKRKILQGLFQQTVPTL
jgi:hypothetical protein